MTVIVLIILAGVGLSFVLGDNGILKRAQDSSDAYKNKAGEEANALAMVNGYLENKLGNDTTGGGGASDEISNSTSYVGYYADSDGDGTVDGIIYADLAVGGSKTGNNNNYVHYEYAKVTGGLKSYTVSSNEYTGLEGKWKQPFISVKKGSTGNDRFYVMALEDINPGKFGWWYHNATGNLNNPIAGNYNDFGQGRSNTATMITKWNEGKYGTQHKDDLWGSIQGKTVDDNGNITTDETKNYVSKGWFVPSKAEWAAFGDMVNTKIGFEEIGSGFRNYYGLSGKYWTSAQYDNSHVFGVNFDAQFWRR